MDSRYEVKRIDSEAENTCKDKQDYITFLA